MKDYEYVVLEEGSRDDLAAQVEEHRSRGFRCVGGVSAETIQGSSFYAQAMERDNRRAPRFPPPGGN